MFLSDLSIKQPVFATMMMLALVVLGVFSYRELSIDLFPNVDLPVVSVRTLYPGVAPETIETEVTKRIEEAINPIQGVRHITSTTSEGFSSVVAEFELGTNIHTAAQDVRSKVSAMRRDFPTGVEEPVIERLDPADMPILSLSVTSPRLSPKQLTSLTEKVIKKRLENVQGVGSVTIVGGQRREIQVLVDTDKLKAYSLTVPEVISALRVENMEVPAGKVNQGPIEELVRVEGKFADPPSFEDMVVKSVRGVPLHLSDVASVADGYEEQRTLALVDGKRALALEIRKQSGSNTVDVAETIKAFIPRLNAELPNEARLQVVRDTSTFIRDSVDDVRNTLIIGAIFTVLVVFVFLNSWRSTVITGLTLPVSIISAFVIMKMLGFTLNILTLMGLSLAVGLLIDDAIVVRENIVRHMQQGRDHFEAARVGTSEIGLAVMATTFSIIAVFVPVAFMRGIVGRFFYEFGLTVAFAVLVSLFVSFTLDPMLSSRWYDPAIAGGRRRGLSRLLEAFDHAFERFHHIYERIIAGALRHRFLVLAAALLIFAASLGLFPRLGTAFFPEFDRGEFQVSFKTAAASTLEQTEAVAQDLIARLSHEPAVEYTFTTIGASASGALNEGSIYIKLKPKNQRDFSYDVLREKVRREFASISAAQLSVEDVSDMGDAKPIQISVRGPELTGLDRFSSEIASVARTVPGAADIDRSLDRSKPEVKVRIDRKQAGDLGIQLSGVAMTLRAMLNGEVATEYEDEDGDAYDVRVRLASQQRRAVETLDDVEVLSSKKNAAGHDMLIPVGQVASFQRGSGSSQIRRMDMTREVRVTANTAGRPLGDVLEDIRNATTAQVKMPPGYEIVYTGDAQELQESFGYIYQALVLAILFIYIILASQFGSFVHPFSIMLSLPLSLVGMVGMLMLTGDSLNIMAMIGLILLMGLVTKNAILLIDYTNRLRRDGMRRDEALVKAGSTRLRPIVMTTLAMIFGMLPLALQIGAGSEIRSPMARAVIGGLITSTLLTLVAVPVVYSLLDDLTGGRRREQKTA